MAGPPAGPGRLTRRTDFVAAASGRRFHTERMTVQGRSRGEAEQHRAGLRIGFTVTKKVGHATERNRIRRRLRQAARSALVSHAGAHVDLVVIARRDALGAAFADLVGDLERAARTLTRQTKARLSPAHALS